MVNPYKSPETPPEAVSPHRRDARGALHYAACCYVAFHCATVLLSWVLLQLHLPWAVEDAMVEALAALFCPICPLACIIIWPMVLLRMRRYPILVILMLLDVLVWVMHLIVLLPTVQ